MLLDCPIRPSLAFLGVVADSPAGERVVAEAEEKLLQGLARIETLNFIQAPRETVDRVLDAEKTTRRSLAGGGDADQVRKVTEKLVEEIANLGIQRVWMQQGAESEAASRTFIMSGLSLTGPRTSKSRLTSSSG